MNEKKKMHKPGSVNEKKFLMIVAKFCFDEKLKLKRVGNFFKISLKYYQRKALRPTFAEETQFLYPRDFQ